MDELIPGKLRGTVDLIVNGTYWLGATVGSAAALYLLRSHAIPQTIGWRYAFGIGGTLGAIVLVLRLYVPESPRWLMLRGYEKQAAAVVADIEHKISRGDPQALPPVQ